MLACAGLIACGAEEPSGSVASWGDIPVYPGSKQIEKGNWELPAVEAEYSTTDWRYYEIEDSMDMVVDFYKSQMFGKGWTKRGWVESEEASWCSYSKNNAMDGVLVWICPEGDKTILALMRGSV